MALIRSVIFWIGLVLSSVIITPIIPLLYPLPYRLRYAYAQLWTGFNLWWLKFTCGLNYRVEGIENIPDTPCIIVCKHQSAWETMALQRIFPPQVWVMKKSLRWIPFFGWALASMEPIAIDRSSGRKAMNQVVEQGQRSLDAGRWVVIFPEGTRVPPGKKGRYGIGAALLACETRYPAIPVALNSGEFWRRNDFVKHPGTVDVVIGKPVTCEDKQPSEFNKQLEDWIESQMERIGITPYTGEVHKRK